jgi:anti-anti-sigma factor
MTDVLHTIRIDTRGPVVLAVIAGEIDASNTATIASELLTHTAGTMIIDLDDVRYLDSAGIAMLDQLRRTCELLLVVPEHSIIHRTMKIVGFDQLVPFFTSVDDALASATRP